MSSVAFRTLFSLCFYFRLLPVLFSFTIVPRFVPLSSRPRPNNVGNSGGVCYIPHYCKLPGCNFAVQCSSLKLTTFLDSPYVPACVHVLFQTAQMPANMAQSWSSSNSMVVMPLFHCPGHSLASRGRAGVPECSLCQLCLRALFDPPRPRILTHTHPYLLWTLLFGAMFIECGTFTDFDLFPDAGAGHKRSCC